MCLGGVNAGRLLPWSGSPEEGYLAAVAPGRKIFRPYGEGVRYAISTRRAGVCKNENAEDTMSKG